MNSIPRELNSANISNFLDNATMLLPASAIMVRGILCLSAKRSMPLPTLIDLLFSMMKKLTELEIVHPATKMEMGYDDFPRALP